MVCTANLSVHDIDGSTGIKENEYGKGKNRII